MNGWKNSDGQTEGMTEVEGKEGVKKVREGWVGGLMGGDGYVSG